MRDGIVLSGHPEKSAYLEVGKGLEGETFVSVREKSSPEEWTRVKINLGNGMTLALFKYLARHLGYLAFPKVTREIEGDFVVLTCGRAVLRVYWLNGSRQLYGNIDNFTAPMEMIACLLAANSEIMEASDG